MKRRLVRLVALLGLVGASSSGYASILFSESLTGAQLATDPRVSFPTRQPVVQGTSLFFAPGSAFREKLFVLPLVLENTLSTAEPLIVSVSMRFIVQQSTEPSFPEDHDPAITVGDGSRIIGFIAADNTDGDGAAAFYEDMGTYGVGWSSTLFTNVGYPAIGQTLDVQTRITLLGDSSEVYGAFGSKSGSQTFPQTLNRDQAISLIFMAHDKYEQYKIESLSVEVQGTVVPEPSTLAIWSVLGGLGVGIAWLRKRRTDNVAEGGTTHRRDWRRSGSG